MAGISFLRVVSNNDLAKQEAQERERAMQQTQSDPLITGLAAHSTLR